jgi:sugar phosphate isomerase/epimerase
LLVATPLTRDEVICAYFTLGGLTGTADLETRAAAVAAAGFSSMGLLGDRYRAELEAGRTDADIRAILAQYGVRVTEIEFLMGWSSVDPGFDWREQEEQLLHLAEVVGADHLNCGDVGMTGPMLPIDDVAERFAGICSRAAERDLRVALEFLPWTEIPDVRTAWQIVERAGAPNGGILLDAWHYFRGPSTAEELSVVPPEHIVVVQLDDAGPPEGEMAEDTSYRRRLPGQGEFDLVGLLRHLDTMGVDAPISVEIMNEQFSLLAPDDAARQAYAATATVLAAARS